MNVNTELLEYIYQTSDMGVKSTTYLLQDLNHKDNKIKNEIEQILKEYEKIFKESKELLKKHKVKPKEKSKMADLSSFFGIKMEVMKDNSDRKIADMLLQGLTMGIIEMEKKIEDYQDKCDKDILKIAKDLLAFEQNHTKKVKEYL